MRKTANISWKRLYQLGAVATLIAALVFRRNLGAEITLITAQSPPTDAAGWFTLLHSNSLLGASLLNVFDTVNYVLVGVMFLALFFALRHTNRNWVATATAFCFVGIVVYLVSNTAFSMLSLSSQYATATADAQRSTLLASGQAILANGDPGAIYEGIGGYMSLFLIAAAGLLISAVMLRSRTFNRATGLVGIVACTLDLVYLAGVALVPSQIISLSVACLATAGLLLLVWHLLIGAKFIKLSKTTQATGGANQ